MLLAILFQSATALAQDFTFGGHAKTQSTISKFQNEDAQSVLGPDQTFTQEVDLRLTSEASLSDFRFAAHGQLLSLSGDGLDAQRQIAGLFAPFQSGQLLIDDQRRLFDLSQLYANDENFALSSGCAEV